MRITKTRNAMSEEPETTAQLIRAMSALLRNFLAIWKELEGCGIQTVSLPGRRRTVGEDVALVTAASCAADLDPTHAVGAVVDLCQVFFVERRVERGPACSRIELVL